MRLIHRGQPPPVRPGGHLRQVGGRTFQNPLLRHTPARPELVKGPARRKQFSEDNLVTPTDPDIGSPVNRTQSVSAPRNPEKCHET